MKKTKITGALILIIAVILSSCSGTSKATVGLDIQSTAPAGAQAGLGRAAAPEVAIDVKDKTGAVSGSLVLTKAFIAVKEIEIEMEGSDDNESEYTGPFLVDLLSNTVTPELPLIELPVGEYDEIEMEIDKLTEADTDGNGNPLGTAENNMDQRSLYLEGQYTPTGGAAVDFVLAYDTEEEILLADADSVNSFAVTDLTELIVAFRMDQWFDFSNPETNPAPAVDFSSLSAGSIILDETTAAGTPRDTLKEVIQENIEESGDFGEDSDGDGELGEDEDDD